ncbi:hypothetical protein C8R44DRAFT_991883 [Mycena epipterygia]|nr:hypothetical protein C8R44DRAFT_991883 [Mycena epipterygia]
MLSALPGALNELRLHPPKGTPVQALSGTLPPHIKSGVVDHLNFNKTTFLCLKLSTNHPNTIYATHRIVGSLSDFHSLDFMISIPFTRIIKAVVFFDDTQLCSEPENLFRDLAREIPPQNYSFLLHHVQGLHVENIDAVIDYGLLQIKLTGLQRSGRCGRCGQMSVYLVMAEPWAYTASVDTADPDSNDPDRPIPGRLTKNSRKPARARLAMVLYINHAKMSLHSLDISTDWCCDLDHPNDPGCKFDKRTFFAGRFIYAGEKGAVYAGDVVEQHRLHLNPSKGKKRKEKGAPNRKLNQCGNLQDRLRTWFTSAHASDPLRAVRPPSYLFNRRQIPGLESSIGH